MLFRCVEQIVKLVDRDELSQLSTAAAGIAGLPQPDMRLWLNAGAAAMLALFPYLDPWSGLLIRCHARTPSLYLVIPGKLR
jgi:hypothetical protein